MVWRGVRAPRLRRKRSLLRVRGGAKPGRRLPRLHGEPEATHAGDGTHDQAGELSAIAAAALAGHLLPLPAALTQPAVHDHPKVPDLAEGPPDIRQQEGPMRGKNHAPRLPRGPGPGAGRTDAVGDSAIPGIPLGQGSAAPRADGPHGGRYTAERPACQGGLSPHPLGPARHRRSRGAGHREGKFSGYLAVCYLL